MIDRTFIYLAIYFRTAMASQCKLNLLWFKTGRFADQPHLHSMKVLLPWYNHPFRFDQLHGPIRIAPFLKIKTYFEITYAFQKMPLVAEVLVWDISNYGDVSIPPFGLLQNTAFNSSVLSSQIASTQFTWPASEVILGKKSALYSDQGLCQRIMWSDNCDVFCSLRSRRLEVVGTRKKRAREKETREGRGSSLTPRVSPSRVRVLSFAQYFQAPATQATYFALTQSALYVLKPRFAAHPKKRLWQTMANLKSHILR